MANIFRHLSIAAALAIAVSSVPAHATVVPVGVQNDVAIADVTGAWGWSLLYRDNYNVFDVDLATLFAGLGAGDMIMLGGIRDGSDTIDVLAATTFTDATTFTLLNTTTTSNGAEWYFNNYSWGFAGLGDLISQNSADIGGPGERDRLSWHTGGAGAGFDQGAGPNLLPIQMDAGWRSGSNTNLNNRTDWDKLIFVARVPEPGTLALLGLGLVGIAARRRKKV